MNNFQTTKSGLNTSSIAPFSAGSEERSNAIAPVHITSVDMRGCVSIAGNQFSCDFNRVRRYAVTHMLVVQQKQSARPPARRMYKKQIKHLTKLRLPFVNISYVLTSVPGSAILP